VITTTTSPTRRVVTTLGEDMFGYAITGVGIGVVVFVANIVPNAVWGEIDSSVWTGASVFFQYLMLAVGVTVAYSHMPVYLGHGITRRDFTTGALVVLGGLAVGAAVATTLGFGVEHLVYRIADWPHVLDNQAMHVYERPDEYGLILVEVLSLYVTHAIAGLVIVTGIARLGAVVGSVVLVAGVAIALGAEMALASGIGAPLGAWLGVEAPSAAVGVAVAAGLAVVGTLAARALLVAVELDSTDATPWR
jgi:hypothetical protein